MPKAYTSSLSRAQFELIEPLLPKAKPDGRPRSVELFVVLNAILYVVVQGRQRRDIPGDLWPWSTAYTYFRTWRQDGTWTALHDRVRGWVRAEAGRPDSPSEAILDSQSVATATMVNQSVGYDVGKKTKGRKRHAVVDTLGLLLCVVVTAASLPEREGGKRVLENVSQMGQTVNPTLSHLGGWWISWTDLHRLGDGHVSMGNSCGVTTERNQRVCSPQKAMG